MEPGCRDLLPFSLPYRRLASGDKAFQFIPKVFGGAVRASEVLPHQSERHFSEFQSVWTEARSKGALCLVIVVLQAAVNLHKRCWCLDFRWKI